MSDLPEQIETVYIRSKENERIVVRSLPAPGPPGPPGDVPLSFELEFTISRFFPNLFRELIYEPNPDPTDSPRVKEIDSYDGPDKAALIFKKFITYDISGKISSTVTTHLSSGATLIKAFNRGADGRFISVDRVYTP